MFHSTSTAEFCPWHWFLAPVIKKAKKQWDNFWQPLDDEILNLKNKIWTKFFWHTVLRNPTRVPSLNCIFGGPDSLNAFAPALSRSSLMLCGRVTREISNGSQSDAQYSRFMLKNGAYSALDNDASLSGKGDFMESTSIEKNHISDKIAASGLPSFFDSSLNFTRDCSGSFESVASSSPFRARFKFFGAMRQE